MRVCACHLQSFVGEVDAHLLESVDGENFETEKKLGRDNVGLGASQ